MIEFNPSVKVLVINIFKNRDVKLVTDFILFIWNTNLSLL